MKFMGLDIGGANTDCIIIEVDDEFNILSTKKYKQYLPFWKDYDKLPECLMKLSENDRDIDVICVSITAELADCYLTKKEGVLDISQKVVNTFKDKIIKFVTFEGLKDYKYVKENPLSAAAANWIGTVNTIKYIKNDCIFMDMGTTTTDIIPIKNRKEITTGYSDTERLGSGELVYTGLLRTNLACIVNEVPINNIPTKVSSELFTITADIHRILGHITEDEYTCDTPDGKAKDIISCKSRLSRLVCADIETLSDEQLEQMACYIYEKQVDQVTEALKKVVKKTGIETIIISDIGYGNICQRAAQKLNLDIINLSDYLSQETTSIITTIGAIQMYIEKYISSEISLIKIK